jgi:general nucleoside transport system permease protein
VTLLFVAALLRQATPLILTAMGGTLSERAGVVNIALEGKLLAAACVSVLVCGATGSVWAGGLAGVLAGALVGLLHALLTQSLRVEPILSGVALNLGALGATDYAVHLSGGRGLEAGHTAPVEVFIVLAALSVVALWLVLFRTPLGLRLRACGERPGAATAAGVAVVRMRYGALTAAGGLVGLGGSTLALGGLGAFTSDMSAGRGFIALAAVILGRWNPLWVAAAALLFGLGDALQVELQTRGIGVPSQFLELLPYALTLLALLFLKNKSAAPAAL